MEGKFSACKALLNEGQDIFAFLNRNLAHDEIFWINASRSDLEGGQYHFIMLTSQILGYQRFTIFSGVTEKTVSMISSVLNFIYHTTSWCNCMIFCSYNFSHFRLIIQLLEG